jgi:hypothetical protein
MRMALVLVIALVTADTAYGQYSRYEQYGTDLYRIPRYGTLDVPRYRERNSSDHAKGVQPIRPWHDYYRRERAIRGYDKYRRYPY